MKPRSMENGFKARPKDVSEQYESELRGNQGGKGRGPSADLRIKKSGAACSTRTRTRKVAAGGNGRGRSLVSLVKFCRWLGFPRRSLYYRSKPRQRVINPDLTARVKLALERFPTYGYRRLACILGENRKPIQCILQLKGWQVSKRPQGFGPRARSYRPSRHGLMSAGRQISRTCGAARIAVPAWR